MGLLVALSADFDADVAGGVAAPDADAPDVSSPTTATPATRSPGSRCARTELDSHVLAVLGAQPVFSRNKQLKMPIHMKSTKCQ